MEKMVTISELVLEAIKFACASHALQRYEGEAYDVHLQEVDDILCEYGFTQTKYRCGGWLHDILEGTDYSYNDIKKRFGVEVAEIVFLCTDYRGRTRHERKSNSFYGELRENKDAIVIKLADRIANMRKSVKTGHSMGIAYGKEHEHFKEMLYFEGHATKMWEEADRLSKILTR